MTRGLPYQALICLILAGPVPAESPKTQLPPLFQFIVISDPHVSDDRPGQPTGREKFKNLLKKIGARPERPDFILITGDIHVTAFRQALADSRSTIPLHVVPGNHERRPDRNALAALFPRDFKGADFYSFEHKGCRFIGLADAADNGDHIGHFDSEGIKGDDQGGWLKKELADHAQKASHVFIFAHIPPNPAGKAGRMFLSTNDQTYLKSLVRQYKPTALFFGHLHGRMEFQLESSPVYVLPSVNWNFGTNRREFFQVTVFKDRIQATYVPL
jgi:3',5'-cyclic AMP phosphodiesterase CpdA